MAEPTRREPKLARTDFESMTHEQLAALLASANTAGASHLSSKLSKAASTITKIGDDLMTYVKGLEWQGEGGDAFRDWGGQTAGSTLRLGQYAEVAARWMGTVSEAIAEAKAAMPDVSETTRAKTDLADAHKTITAANQPGGHNDPDAQKLAATARTNAAAAEHRIEAARGEAIQQLRKLAQTYEFSAQQVNSVAPPTFSPPADHMEPKQWVDSSRHVSVGSGGSSRPSGVSHGQNTQGGAMTRHDTGHSTPQRVTEHGTSVQAGPTQPATTTVNSVGTLPANAELTSTTQSPSEANTPHPGVSVPNQPTALPTVFKGYGRATGSSSSARLSPSPRLPKPTATGLPIGGPTGSQREPGITGGRPVNPNTARTASGIPRGTVIGKESPQSRIPMGRGTAPGASASGQPRPGNGLVGGRRVASEAGGVVGSRPGQPSRNSGRPFTAGGSGLVNPSSSRTESSRSPLPGRGSTTNRVTRTRKDQRQDGRRPDYLVEEAETWRSDSRSVLPPVVD
jgi:hypothetical protein